MHQSKGGSFFAFLATRKAEFKIFPYIGDGKALRTGRRLGSSSLNSAGDSTVSFKREMIRELLVTNGWHRGIFPDLKIAFLLEWLDAFSSVRGDVFGEPARYSLFSSLWMMSEVLYGGPEPLRCIVGTQPTGKCAVDSHHRASPETATPCAPGKVSFCGLRVLVAEPLF